MDLDPKPPSAPSIAIPSAPAYTARHAARSLRVPVRGLRYHLLRWHGQAAGARPLRVMLHGFLDVGASFQFVVDAMREPADTVAPDWRGFGLTRPAAATDSYWFADYFGDLDAMLDRLSPDAPVDLIGHSMGGNVAMAYAGLRPQRIRRLVNLEGFGMPDMTPAQALERQVQWLDSLRKPSVFKPYDSLAEVARRMQAQNARLSADKALWLARRWARRDAAGAWLLRADPAHRRPHAVPHRAAETLHLWSSIRAPVLFVQAEHSGPEQWWHERYTQAMLDQRLAVVPGLRRQRVADAGHMLHHDQPAAVAAAIEGFLRA